MGGGESYGSEWQAGSSCRSTLSPCRKWWEPFFCASSLTFSFQALVSYNEPAPKGGTKSRVTTIKGCKVHLEKLQVLHRSNLLKFPSQIYNFMSTFLPSWAEKGGDIMKFSPIRDNIVALHKNSIKKLFLTNLNPEAKIIVHFRHFSCIHRKT